MNNTSTLKRFDNSAKADHIFALFVYEEHEASGGIYDLKLTGSMLACVQLALKSDHEMVSQIVGLPSMQLYRTGEWVRKQHSLVGGAASHEYEWTLHCLVSYQLDKNFSVHLSSGQLHQLADELKALADT